MLAFYLDKRKDVMSFLASWVVDVKPRQYLARYFAVLAIVMGGAIRHLHSNDAFRRRATPGDKHPSANFGDHFHSVSDIARL